MSFDNITIVITSFKSDEKIKDCLNSINKNCKVLVIENSNDIIFKKKIENEFSNTQCILTGSNLGYGAANNIGLKNVKTKYALILNPDTLLEKSTINNFFNEIKSIKNFAIAGPHIQTSSNKYKKKFTDLNPMPTNNVKGFAMFLNLPEFKNTGFFDENFFIYFEEIDLCKRLIKEKKKIYLLPTVQVIHSGGQSHNIEINEEMEFSRNWHWMWSTFYFHKKHKSYLIALVIVFPKLFSAVLKFILYSLTKNINKKKIYFYRCSGLINSIIGKNSWYRPKV